MRWLLKLHGSIILLTKLKHFFRLHIYKKYSKYIPNTKKIKFYQIQNFTFIYLLLKWEQLAPMLKEHLVLLLADRNDVYNFESHSSSYGP